MKLALRVLPPAVGAFAKALAPEHKLAVSSLYRNAVLFLESPVPRDVALKAEAVGFRPVPALRGWVLFFDQHGTVLQ